MPPSIETGQLGSLLAESLAESLAETDRCGRFRPATARRVREAIAALEGQTSLLQSPVDLFGPWECLSGHSQAVFRWMAERHIHDVLALHPRGRLWSALTRFCYARRSGKWAARIWRRPMMTYAAALRYRRRRRWRRARRPSLTDLLAHLGHTPEWLMGDFVEGVRVDPRVRGFHFDRSQGTAHGFLIGIDLLPTARGVVLLEMNTGAGLMNRSQLWSEDPLPMGLVDFASSAGFEELVWVAGSLTPLDRDIYLTTFQRARSAGIRLSVVEDPRLPRRSDLPSEIPPPSRSIFLPAGTGRSLVVISRSWGLGPGYLASNKEGTARTIRHELEGVGETRLRVLPLTEDPGAVAPPAGPGWPNLVYKYPLMDKGEGVHFLRARDAAHAREMGRTIDARTGERGGRFQAFVPPRLDGGLRWEVRVMLLVSPFGVHYLGASQRVAAEPDLPPLPWGIVEDRGRFIVTRYFGHTNQLLNPSLEPEIAEAARIAGRSLARALRRTFLTGDPPPREGLVTLGEPTPS